LRLVVAVDRVGRAGGDQREARDAKSGEDRGGSNTFRPYIGRFVWDAFIARSLRGRDPGYSAKSRSLTRPRSKASAASRARFWF